MRAFVVEIVADLRAFLKESRTPESLVMLGYVLIILTHKVALDDDRLIPLLREFLPQAGDRLIRKLFLDVVFFAGVPLLLIKFLQRQSPIRDYGLRLPAGRWIALTGAIFFVQLFGIVIAARIPSLREFYPMYRPARAGGAIFWGFQAGAFLSMVSWEFVNRGYLLLGLKPRFGLAAIGVQVIPFGILHYGKPILELYWSVFDGIGLALLAYVSGSIWPAVWLHGVGALLLDVTLVYFMPP